MPESPLVKTVVDDHIATVTIDRPERRNALSRQAWLELRTAIQRLADEERVRGMIVTGAGDRAFAAGADVAELAEREPAVALDGLAQRILLEVERLPFPTIAALNGDALGGGWELCLACDLRVAVRTARVGFPEVSLGIMPGAGGSIRLLRHVGLGLAKEWIFTGRILTAEEASTYGLLNRVVEPGEAMPAALELMETLVAQPPTSIRLAKLVLDAASRADATPELERLAYTLTYYTPERAERMHRFLNRHADQSRHADPSED